MTSTHLATALAAATILAGCATRPPTPQTLPAYIAQPREPFSRSTAIAIAEREWRAFGGSVQDDPADPPPEPRPDRQPGLWQRVGDYWSIGLDGSAITAKYDEAGREYPGLAPAWSAAFISYVIRVAGAGDRFPYSPLHADYINAAARHEGILRAEPPSAYAPRPGDLICLARGDAETLRFDDLPGPRFQGHCDLVTASGPGTLTVIGGNVAASVTLRHVRTDPAGHLTDPRWFVILRVLYDAP